MSNYYVVHLKLIIDVSITFKWKIKNKIKKSDFNKAKNYQDWGFIFLCGNTFFFFLAIEEEWAWESGSRKLINNNFFTTEI